MKIAGWAVLGLFVGIGLGFLNRPSYFGGLYKPTASEVLNNKSLLEDAGDTVVTYGAVGLFAGLVVGGILFRSKEK